LARMAMEVRAVARYRTVSASNLVFDVVPHPMPNALVIGLTVIRGRP
jgi:hypothetical protein